MNEFFVAGNYECPYITWQLSIGTWPVFILQPLSLAICLLSPWTAREKGSAEINHQFNFISCKQRITISPKNRAQLAFFLLICQECLTNCLLFAIRLFNSRVDKKMYFRCVINICVKFALTKILELVSFLSYGAMRT